MLHWLRHYVAALPQMPPTLSSEEKLERFLTDMAVQRDMERIDGARCIRKTPLRSKGGTPTSGASRRFPLPLGTGGRSAQEKRFLVRRFQTAPPPG